ncbi:MAG: hypothetical protein ACOC85_04705 [Thermoplasmatota archaeon]
MREKMSFLDCFKKFFKGAFDYENPSAGCGCCGIEADPGIKKVYYRSRIKSK